MNTPRLRRLLGHRVAQDYLRMFNAIVPQVAVAILNLEKRPLVKAGPGNNGQWDTEHPLRVDEHLLGYLVASGEALQAPRAMAAWKFLIKSIELLLNQAWAVRTLGQETLERYREINLLYTIGSTIGATLDPEALPDMVAEEVAHIIQADGGVVLQLEDMWQAAPQKGAASSLKMSVQSQFGPEAFATLLHDIAVSRLQPILRSGQSAILTPEHWPAFATHLSSILIAPLKSHEHILGFLILGRGADSPVFNADDKKLLTALASQAAIASENARLFTDIKAQRDAIAEIKNYMDNIFASIASGVITIDMEDRITLVNHAAAHIFNTDQTELLGKPYTAALPDVRQHLAALVKIIKQQGETITGYEITPVLPTRGKAVLRLSLSPLRDNQKQINGVAIVVEDMTERRHLEARVQQIRQTFEQYVVPRVVDKLLSDPNSVRLGGTRREVTVLFADIRGFTSFSEHLEPERSVEVLNRYLTIVADAIFSEEGTLDKFLGDGAMAIYNTPLFQEDHILRAIRSALAIQFAITELHKSRPQDPPLYLGIGIATGPAIVGNIGSSILHDYTAIGDSVNLAARLQAQAKPGQILLNSRAYEQVKDHIFARELGYLQIKGHSAPDLIYEVLDLREGDEPLNVKFDD